ncbi:hypothetical protein HanHA300_Chr04g0120151 [Helianthus annuus]|nr:hypothetical protein HanHA300_Chr04g0120151 [Helianthus annuus]KAJ0595535.1 hypothetical protein HanHA89_Chr04g0132411 [Helianthus annuus]
MFAVQTEFSIHFMNTFFFHSFKQNPRYSNSSRGSGQLVRMGYLFPCVAAKDVVRKVLSEPIRPQFAIASVDPWYYHHRLEAHKLISTKLGSKVPVITILSKTNMGRDAIFNESEEDMEKKGIMLTVGFLPGMKVKQISLLQKEILSFNQQAFRIDKFLKDIRKFSTSISGCRSPAAIMIFSRNPEGLIAVMRKVDHAMSPETVIVGAYGCGFQHTDGYLGNKISTEKHVTAYALVFATENNKGHGIGEIKFHAVLSSGLQPFGPVYAASVKKRYSFYTGLTARIEGSRENLSGGTLLSQAYVELGGGPRHLYIGVTKRRKFSIGREKVRWITSVAFHEVEKINYGWLIVNDTDMDIRTGDTFRFYCHDPTTGNISNHLRSFKQGSTTHSDEWEVFGGLIFTSFGRGKSFDNSLFMDNFPGVTRGCTFYGRVFGRGDLTPCVDNSPFLDNFPRLTCGGTFCGWLFGCGEKTSYLSKSQERKWVRHCVHEYEALYLIMSYIP